VNKLCETRWVEHLKSIILFKERFIIICKAKREIQEHPDSDSESTSKAYSLLSATEKCNFATAMVTISKVFILSHNFLTSLQSETIDISYFLEHNGDLKSEVRYIRHSS
jgi:hypothetical protein